MNQHEVEDALMAFIREEFLWGDENRELEPTSPLLEWGVIDSLRTALLLAHIRERFGAHVSPALVNARNFHDVRSIAAVVTAELAPAGAAKEDV